jgi:hypothetical protein
MYAGIYDDHFVKFGALLLVQNPIDTRTWRSFMINGGPLTAEHGCLCFTLLSPVSVLFWRSGKCVCEMCSRDKMRILKIDDKKLFRVCNPCGKELKSTRVYGTHRYNQEEEDAASAGQS